MLARPSDPSLASLAAIGEKARSTGSGACAVIGAKLPVSAGGTAPRLATRQTTNSAVGDGDGDRHIHEGLRAVDGGQHRADAGNDEARDRPGKQHASSTASPDRPCRRGRWHGRWPANRSIPTRRSTPRRCTISDEQRRRRRSRLAAMPASDHQQRRGDQHVAAVGAVGDPAERDLEQQRAERHGEQQRRHLLLAE